MNNIQLFSTTFECKPVTYLESRWSEWNFKVHGNRWPSPFLLRISFQKFDFSRQLCLFHSSHPFNSLTEIFRKISITSLQIIGLNLCSNELNRNKTHFHTIAFSDALYLALPFKQISCTPDVLSGVGIFTSIFWPSNDGLKFDLRTT